MNKRLISFIIIFGVIAVISIGYIALRTYIYPIKYKEQVITYSKDNDLDPYLALAVINTESKFNKNAVSSKDAKGLMQITESTAREINDTTHSTDEIDGTNIYDIDINLEIGCNYLASLIERYKGNYYIAICAYNAGIGNVNKWIEQGIISSTLDTTDVKLPFSETTNYLKKVINSYEAYKKIYPSLA